MKRLKKIVSLFAAAALLVLAPGVKQAQVSAAEPVTYSLKYVEESGEWRFQEGPWDDYRGHRELYYMKQALKDGDLVVIEGGSHGLTLDLPVNLGNLTFKQAYSASVTVKGADNVYVLRDSTASITGNVVNAHVYDNAIANFNNNVTNLYITKERDALQTVAVVGTVSYVKTGDAEKVYSELYNFQANSFRQEKGVLKTDASQFSILPTVVPPVLPVDPNTPALPVAPVDPTTPVAPVTPIVPVTPVVPVVPTAPSDSLYDDVPKTGEPVALPGLLVMGAGLCFGGAYLLKRKNA